MTCPKSPLTTATFDYECPQALIAQHPASERASSRLLQLDRASGSVRHGTFADFPTLLRAGDVLVVNASRVINARLHGVRQNGAPAEVLLVHPEPDDTWLAMVHPGGKLKVGRTIRFGDAAELEITEVLGGGLRRVRRTGVDWTTLIERYGSVPLPPYINRPPDDDDASRYQTVYAHVDGSVAAPTAGLHFTPEVLERIEALGVAIAEIVLHIGPGTFKPVAVDDPAEHAMHAEWYRIPQETADAVNQAREAGGRVWAVGTTATRVLETIGADGPLRAGEGWTKLFIYPPYDFRAVDGLLTNFHLPRSTLLMLVCAFGGVEHVLSAYRTAVAERYRLYSYGDAMAIV
jgi:S-adenosylmethionine:tRNA ribosyltransferase-isomerase